MEVYVLEDTSHPLILGANYMRQHGLKLDFSNQSVTWTKSRVWAKKRTTIPRKFESIFGVKCRNISIQVIKVSVQEALMYIKRNCLLQD